ncbi:MAG: 6-pyruvoyl trahydropterin synthase family protein [Candidatus Heimdallarchaeaceae archaeon]
MYRIEKRFIFPMGHRLSKHNGRCYSIHGHNFTVLVGIKAPNLNGNDMIMDFSNLKFIVDEFLDSLDHCLLLNQDQDQELLELLRKMRMRVTLVDFDPTAEKLSEQIYWEVKGKIEKVYPDVKMDYVIVFENENSKATYSEE